MANTKIPDPAVMPVDREAWWKHPLHLVNFMNAYATYRDLRSLDGVRTVLIVGPGQVPIMYVGRVIAKIAIEPPKIERVRKPLFLRVKLIMAPMTTRGMPMAISYLADQ